MAAVVLVVVLVFAVARMLLQPLVRLGVGLISPDWFAWLGLAAALWLLLGAEGASDPRNRR